MRELNIKQALATGLIGAHLMAGTPSVALAKDTHQHTQPAVKQYSDVDIVNTIVGEASNQGYNGMLAIACAIRNRMRDPYHKRDILRGAYGLHAGHTKSEPKWVFDTANKAWSDSANVKDITNGATLWGNASDVEKFKKQAWFKNVVQSAKIGAHFFFKDAR